MDKEMRIKSTKVLQQLSSVLEHLHNVVFEHNNVHLGDIMATDTGSVVLIDLEFRRRF